MAGKPDEMRKHDSKLRYYRAQNGNLAETTNLARLGTLTHNDVLVSRNVGRVVIDVQDLNCDWNVADQLWIV